MPEEVAYTKEEIVNYLFLNEVLKYMFKPMCSLGH